MGSLEIAYHLWNLECADLVDRYYFIMLEYEKVLSDCLLGGTLQT